MGIYSNLIFPRLLDAAMSGEPCPRYRQAVLSQVSGNILEIGFGTGLNLSYYPDSIKHLTIVDPNPGVTAIAQKRIAASPIDVQTHVLSGENLPFADASFDTVVSTWTLCSIPNVQQALSEIYRVLKPNGRFCFVEHGLSKDTSVQTWQNRLNPIQKVIGDGCHLNRNIADLVQQQFDRVDIEQDYAEGLPKFIGYTYQGTAWKT